MQLKKNIVFVVHTIYQAYLSMKIISDLKHNSYNEIIVIDLIFDSDCGSGFLEAQCQALSLGLIKISTNSSFMFQLVAARKIVDSIINRIGLVHNLYIFNDVEPVVALFAKFVKKKSR
jgi:hypothetical protein